MKIYILAFGLIMFMPVAGNAVGQAAGGEHSRNMQQMQEDMQRMEKDLQAHRSMQHCMPVMKALREKMDALSLEMMPPGGLQNSIREKTHAPEQ